MPRLCPRILKNQAAFVEDANNSTASLFLIHRARFFCATLHTKLRFLAASTKSSQTGYPCGERRSLDVFSVALDVDEVLAGYDRKIVDRENAVVHLLLDDVGRCWSVNRHLGVLCANNNDINQSINQFY